MNENWPKAYKLGKQDFYGHDFLVTPDVLIPRPETEMMVDAVLNLAGVSILSGVRAPRAVISKTAKILEVGTGSGCVAISIKLALSDIKMTATDISEKALKIAEKNAQQLGADVEFLHSDLMEMVTGEFDVICANLPYVDKNWDWIDQEALAVEPQMALFAEDEGLEIIKRLIREVKERCRFLILEADPSQHDAIKKYASDFALKHIETRGFVLIFGL